MKLLITNDDGFDAEGIRELVKALSKEHDVTVVAPKYNQSCVGHGLTLKTPLYVEEAAIEGAEVPAYCINGRVVETAAGQAFSAGGQTFMTLSRRDSMDFWAYHDTAYLYEKPLLWDGKQLKAELDSGSADVLRWSEEAGRFVPCAHLEGGRDPRPVSVRPVGTGRYTVALSADQLTGHKQVLLRVRYRGDIGHAFAGNELISDNFCNGGDWDIRLDCYAEALQQTPLVLYLTPVRKNVSVDASAMAGLQERADTETAELLSAELLTIDDHPVHL